MSDSAEFYERIKQLYPAVTDLDVLPRNWHKDKTVQHLSLSHNNLRVHYKGSGKVGKDAAAVRTHLPIPTACGVFYYEVKVISKGRDGHIGLGLSGASVSLSRLPGWEKNSFGYHGDDGCAFQSSGTGTQYGPTFSTGDIIGCCWNIMENCVFYTKNGVNLGVAFRDVPSVLYPTVGLQTPGEVVEANFGQHAFAFAIIDYVAECRRRLASQMMLSISDVVEPSSVARRADNELSIRHLVLDYISSQGYSETALALSRLTNEPLADSVQSMRNRHRINKLICSGKISRAIRLTQRLHPEVLSRNAEVLFHLRCRQFIEILNGHDRIDPQFIASASSARSMASKQRAQLNGNGTHSTAKATVDTTDTDATGTAQFAFVDDVDDEGDADFTDEENLEEDDGEDDQFADASSSFDPPTGTDSSNLQMRVNSVEQDDGVEDVEMRDGNANSNGDRDHSSKHRGTTKPKQNGVGCSGDSSRNLSDADSGALIEFGKQLYAQLLALYGVGITSPVTPSGLFTAPAPYPIASAIGNSANACANGDCLQTIPASTSAASAASTTVNWWDQAPPSTSTSTAAANLASFSLFSALSSLTGQFAAANASGAGSSVAAAAAAAAGNPLVFVGLTGSTPIAIPHPLPLAGVGVSLPLGHSVSAPTIPFAYSLSAAAACNNNMTQTSQNAIVPGNPTSTSDLFDGVRVSRFEKERAKLIDMFTQFGCGQQELANDGMQRAREAVATELNAAILASRARQTNVEKLMACNDTTDYRPALDTLLGHLRKTIRQMSSAGIPSAGFVELADFVNPT